MEAEKQKLGLETNFPLQTPLSSLKTETFPQPKGLDVLEQAEIRTELERMQEDNNFSQTEKPKQAKEVNTKKTLKELYQLSQKPQEEQEYFNTVLEQEYQQGRLTSSQLKKFKLEIKSFAPDQLIKDSLWPVAVQTGLYIGAGAGSLLAHIPLANAAGIFASATIFPLSISGLFRLPFLNIRAIGEIKKISQSKGLKTALKTLPFYLGLNVLNLIPIIDWMAAPLLSLPRNKNIALSFINHRVQTGKGPKTFKRLVNWGVQKLLAKAK